MSTLHYCPWIEKTSNETKDPPSKDCHKIQVVVICANDPDEHR
jgi:hypothetical protein